MQVIVHIVILYVSKFQEVKPNRGVIKTKVVSVLCTVKQVYTYTMKIQGIFQN